MTTLILVRHGESEGNISKIFCGHTDVPLTKRGLAQAECTSKYLDQYPIDKIYASDLCRAYATAEATAKHRGIPITVDSNLREIDAGKWEGLHFDKLREEYSEAYGVWRNSIGESCCTEGESVLQLQARIDQELHRIVAENCEKTIAVFTHATPIRAMACLWNGLPLSQMQALEWPSNASITIATFTDDGKIKLVCYGRNNFLALEGLNNSDVKT